MGSHLMMTVVRLKLTYLFQPSKNIQLFFLLKHSDDPIDNGTVQPPSSTDELTKAQKRDVSGSRSQS